MTDLEWCRDFIDHNCIYRSPPNTHTLTSPDYSLNSWQFYLPIAVLDQEFAERIGHLFWTMDGEDTDGPAFQLCGCESGGSLLVAVLQTVGRELGYDVPAFMIKKAAKSYGLQNWIEGRCDPELPVLLVDDVVGSGKTLKTQAARLKEFGLNVIGQWAIAACKSAVAGVETLFGPNDFTKLHTEYVRKYGKEPQFAGTVV